VIAQYLHAVAEPVEFEEGVVAFSVGLAAVVGAADLTVDVAAACVRAGGRTLPEGTLITIDGTGGEVVVGSRRIVTNTTDSHLHRLLEWADEVSGDGSDRGPSGPGRGRALVPPTGAEAVRQPAVPCGSGIPVATSHKMVSSSSGHRCQPSLALT
jgi:hypothetical protein